MRWRVLLRPVHYFASSACLAQQTLAFRESPLLGAPNGARYSPFPAQRGSEVLTFGMHSSMKRVFEDVQTFGWHVVGVLPGSDGAPEFSFSVGFFETYDHPELVIFGLPMQVAHAIIGDCLVRIRQGAPFEAGQVRDDILKKHSIAVLPVDREFYADYLGTAIGFYAGTDFPALQLVWPDKGNYFPWHPEFDSAYAGSQVILSVVAA